jgi:hypothetical protein
MSGRVGVEVLKCLQVEESAPLSNPSIFQLFNPKDIIAL